MLVEDMKCRLCDDNVWEASSHGSYLRRVNEKGITGIYECRPGCKGDFWTKTDALLGAVFDEKH